MEKWGKIDNLNIIIKGFFNNDKLEGYGEVFDKEENINYKGYWKKGLLDGIGIQYNETFIYEGYFKEGKKNGKGIQIYKKENEKYEGEWKDGNYEGYGIYYYSNGNKYIGQWKNNIKEGFGELIWANGKKFIGYFKNDNRDGFGIYLNEKNNISLCFWIGGKKYGIEKCFLNKNKINYKRWKNNKFEVVNKSDIFKIMKEDNKETYINIYNMDYDNIINFMDLFSKYNSKAEKKYYLNI